MYYRIKKANILILISQNSVSYLLMEVEAKKKISKLGSNKALSHDMTSFCMLIICLISIFKSVKLVFKSCLLWKMLCLYTKVTNSASKTIVLCYFSRE